MTAVPVIHDGTGRPQPEQRPLRAGPLDLVYEAGDLRYLRLGGREVVRRWYAAVRDADWGTVPGVITQQSVANPIDQFEISYVAEHVRGPVNFVWRADIHGSADGTIRFEFTGEARSTFRRNRIGFCILHPIAECAGARARLRHADGSAADTAFPKLIAPQNPFKELAGLSHEIEPGLWADWTFEGDVFETEDQRNWTDASFKTFCTPLRLPFPVEVPVGARVRQVVTLTLRGTVPAEAPRESGSTFAVGRDVRLSLPGIGLGTAGHGELLTEREAAHLRLLRPAHLRAETDLTADGWPARLRQAAADAAAVGATLELAVTVSDRAWDETAALIPVLHEVNPPVARALAFHAREWATPERVMTPVVEAFARWDPSVAVFVGTTANFTELNRGRPRPTFSDGGVCFSIHPQVHAFDNRSLVETCAALSDVVESAQAFCGDLPLAVTPVTLKGRVNPYATGPAPPTPPGELPPQVDVRQMSLFGAGWTLAALKYLAESGVASVTFYETTGWLGVMEREDGCPLPERFPSRPGMVFPVFHVLADANFLAGSRVVPSRSSDPLAFDGLALRRGDSLRVMLANLTDRPRTVTVSGLGPRATVRVLDETTFEQATATDVADFRSAPGNERITTNGTLALSLRPYAYARLDTTVPA
jgi:hypothetical protein